MPCLCLTGAVVKEVLQLNKPFILANRLGMSVLAAVTAAVCMLSGCSISKSFDADNTAKIAANDDMIVFSFDAGKADAHLIYTKDNAILIDCGEKGFGKEIVAFMQKNGIKSLDYMIITHFDKDHVGGAAKVMKSVKVGSVLQSNSPKESEEYTEYLNQLKASGINPETVREDTDYTAGDIKFTVNAPAEETYEEDPSNNSSLITSIEYGENHFLFAADALGPRLDEFTNQNTIDYDYLKVPYHGRNVDNTKKFLESTNPEIAVIPTSDDEPESKKTMKKLEEYGCTVYITKDSPVAVRCDGKTLTVEMPDKAS